MKKKKKENRTVLSSNTLVITMREKYLQVGNTAK